MFGAEAELNHLTDEDEMWLLNGRERLQLTSLGCVERCRIALCRCS